MRCQSTIVLTLTKFWWAIFFRECCNCCFKKKPTEQPDPRLNWTIVDVEARSVIGINFNQQCIFVILEIENLQTPKSSISSKWHPNPKKSDWELYPGCTQFHFYIPLIQTFLWISHSSVFFNLFLLSPTSIPYNYMFWNRDLMIGYKPACSFALDNADFPKSFLKTLFPWYWGKIWFLTWT